MQTRFKARMKGRRGATMVEFSLFFLVFLLLSYGLMEGARMLWAYTTLSHAARQGARYAMVHGSGNTVEDTAIEAVVRQNAIGLSPGDITVVTTWQDAAKERGSGVEVEVNYNLHLASSLFVPNSAPLQMASKSRMVVATGGTGGGGGGP